MPKFIVESGRKSTNSQYNIRKKAIRELKLLLTLKLSQRDYTSAIRILETQTHFTGIELSYLWKVAYEVIKQYGLYDTKCLRFLQSALKAGIPNSVEIIKEILYYKLKTNDLRDAQAIIESCSSNPIYFKEADIYGYNGILHLAIRESEIQNSEMKNNIFDNRSSRFQNTLDFLGDKNSFDQEVDIFDDFPVLTPEVPGFYSMKNESDDEVDYKYSLQGGRFGLKTAEKHLKEAIRLNQAGTLYLYYLIQVYIASYDFGKAEKVIDDFLEKDNKMVVFLKFGVIVQNLAASYSRKKLLYFQNQHQNGDQSSNYSSEVDGDSPKLTKLQNIYDDNEDVERFNKLKSEIIAFNKKWATLSLALLGLDPLANFNTYYLPYLKFTADEKDKEAISNIIEILSNRIDFGDHKNPLLWEYLYKSIERLRHLYPDFSIDAWQERRNWYKNSFPDLYQLSKVDLRNQRKGEPCGTDNQVLESLNFGDNPDFFKIQCCKAIFLSNL